MKFLNYLEKNKLNIVFFLLLFFMSKEVWNSVSSAFGILNIPERILYYIIYLNLPFYIISYFVLKSHEVKIKKKILFITISIFYYLLLATFIAFNIWQNNNFILECIKYLTVQLMFLFIVYKIFQKQLAFNKKQIFNSIFLFSFIIITSFSYSYYANNR